MNIAEKLTTIAENEQKVYDAGYDKGKTAFGVLGKESGTVVRADNVNENEPTIKAKVSSKNVLPFTPKTMECTVGFYVTINEDGSITLNGESPHTNVVALHTILSGQNVIKKGKTYIQTLRYADGSIVSNDVVYLSTSTDWIKGDHFPTKSLATGNNNVFTVEGAVYDDEYYEHEQFDASIIWQAGTYDNVTVYPQIEENTTATPYTPYVADVTSANVTACGVNMFDLERMKNNNDVPSHYNPQYTENSISVTGTADGAYQMISPKQNFYATGDITISGNGGWRMVVQPRDSEGNYLEDAYPVTISNSAGYGYLALYHGYYINFKHDSDGNFNIKLTIPDKVAYFTIAFVLNAQTYTYTNFQIEVGHTVSAYTPYMAESIDTTYVVGELEQGSFDPNNGSETTTTTRVRTVDYVTLPAGTYGISSTANVYIVMYVYDLNGNFIASESKVDWVTSNIYAFPLVGDRKVRFAFRLPSQGDILPSDVTDVILVCKDAVTYTPNADGILEIPSITPTMTLMTDKQGVNIKCEYYQDGQAVIDELTDAIISLGGMI